MNSYFRLLALLVYVTLDVVLISWLTKATEYDESLAKRFAYFNDVGFCVAEGKSDIVEDWSCVYCSVLSESSDISEIYIYRSSFYDADGLITYDSFNNAITVTFTGSDSVNDWIVNINSWSVDYPGCSQPWWNWWTDDCDVHMGFYWSYDSIADDIYNKVLILTNQYSSAKLEINGNSQGGAFAMLCALDLVNNHDVSIMPDYVYTLGGPKFGDQKLIEYYESTVGNDRTIRVTHGRDPVPVIQINGEFVHGALEIYYPNESDGEYIICDGSGNDPNCISSYGDLTGVDDHLSYLGVHIACNEQDYQSRKTDWEKVSNMTMGDLEDYNSQSSGTSSNNNNKDSNNKGTQHVIIAVGIIGALVVFVFACCYCSYQRMNHKPKVSFQQTNNNNQHKSYYVPPKELMTTQLDDV